LEAATGDTPRISCRPEANLLAVAHYIEALKLQREFIRIQAVLGGKNPHPQTYLMGGMATTMDGNEPDAVINPERITLLNELVANAQEFVRQVYLPDVLAIAGFYPEWFQLWRGYWELHDLRRLLRRQHQERERLLFPARHRPGTRSGNRTSARSKQCN
jgi:Ni,Fe-hydrogenase I large subunit